MKKVISVILAVILAFGAVVFANADSAEIKLQFNKDGNFRIMQVADMQDGIILTPAVTDFLKKVIPEAKPDLIVLSGDNISGGSAGIGVNAIDKPFTKMAIDQFMSVFEEFGIPVAVVFGNHDAENGVSKEEQMAMYMSYDCCVAVDEGDALYGCGTYNLPIYSSNDSSKIAYNLWMVDSNMYDPDGDGYDHVHEDQIKWYQETSNALKAQNGGKAVPSMMFQHIIIPEIYDIIEEVPAGSKDAYESDGKYYGFKEGYLKSGTICEGPCPPDRNMGQFDAVLEQGDVVAMFFGHDHKNSFLVNYKGVDLSTTPGISFGSYGNEERGVRIIDIKEGTTDYETEIIYYLDVYADDELALERYTLYGNEFETGEKIVAFFNVMLVHIKRLFTF